VVAAVSGLTTGTAGSGSAAAGGSTPVVGARRQHRLCSINRPGRCFAVKPERVYSDDLRALGRGADRWRFRRHHGRHVVAVPPSPGGTTTFAAARTGGGTSAATLASPAASANLAAVPAAAIGNIANLIGGAIGIFITNGDEPGENGGFLIGSGAPGSAGQDGGNGGLIGNGGAAGSGFPNIGVGVNGGNGGDGGNGGNWGATAVACSSALPAVQAARAAPAAPTMATTGSH
jgi:hypothetical protein